MIKKGDYCTYNNNEYELTGNMDGDLLILTTDYSLATDGFIDKYNSGVYTKKVDFEEISNCYHIRPYGIYRKERVNVRIKKGDLVHIGTPDASLAKVLGLDRTDKYYYEKWVPIDEVQLFEERKEINLE